MANNNTNGSVWLRNKKKPILELIWDFYWILPNVRTYWVFVAVLKQKLTRLLWSVHFTFYVISQCLSWAYCPSFFIIFNINKIANIIEGGFLGPLGEHTAILFWRDIFLHLHSVLELVKWYFPISLFQCTNQWDLTGVNEGSKPTWTFQLPRLSHTYQ